MVKACINYYQLDLQVRIQNQASGTGPSSIEAKCGKSATVRCPEPSISDRSNAFVAPEALAHLILPSESSFRFG